MIDVSTWEVFFWGARTLVGRAASEYTISPVFEMARGPNPQGQLGTMIFPIGWLPIDSIPLPSDAVSVPLSSLPPGEQRAIAQGVEKATHLLQEMRAAGSGLQIARSMPKP